MENIFILEHYSFCTATYMRKDAHFIGFFSAHGGYQVLLFCGCLQTQQAFRVFSPFMAACEQIGWNAIQKGTAHKMWSNIQKEILLRAKAPFCAAMNWIKRKLSKRIATKMNGTNWSMVSEYKCEFSDARVFADWNSHDRTGTDSYSRTPQAAAGQFFQKHNTEEAKFGRTLWIMNAVPVLALRLGSSKIYSHISHPAIPRVRCTPFPHTVTQQTIQCVGVLRDPTKLQGTVHPAQNWMLKLSRHITEQPEQLVVSGDGDFLWTRDRSGTRDRLCACSPFTSVTLGPTFELRDSMPNFPKCNEWIRPGWRLLPFHKRSARSFPFLSRVQEATKVTTAHKHKRAVHSAASRAQSAKSVRQPYLTAYIGQKFQLFPVKHTKSCSVIKLLLFMTRNE